MITLSAEQAIAILKTAERGGGVYRYLEQSLEALGWRYIGGDYRSPEFVASLPVCRFCHQRFMPDHDACYDEAAEPNGWKHMPVANTPTYDGPLFDPRPIEDK